MNPKAWWRRAPRHPAGWFGKYALDDSSTTQWHACRVIDVSDGGARLELLGPALGDGARLWVDFETPTPDVVRTALPAEVKHVGRGYEGGELVGIAFGHLGDEARMVVDLLIEQQSGAGIA